MKQLRVLLFLCAVVCVQNNAHALFYPQSAPFQDSTELAKKENKKLGFFKRIFQHNDSAQRARRFINEHHKLLRKGGKISFPMEMDSMGMKDSYFETASDFELGYEVFGWYPYWEKNYYKHLNFSLLSTVAYFSYEVDPRTGNAKTIHEWETTKLIDSIQMHPDKRILLTVSNFGFGNNRRFLRNQKAVNRLITNLIPLLSARKANGVCIDFEGVRRGDRDNYTSFLLDLSNRLKSEDESYKIYLAIPSVDFAKSLDFKSLVKAVDRFVIMGYDYYGKTSKVAGPVAPLQSGKEWDPFNLENSINYYLDSGIPGSKLLMALPNYGSLWETESLNLQSKVKKYVGARTYSYIKSRIATKAATYIEPISKSAYSAYSQDNKYRQLWFDNDSTFHYKVNLIKKKKLAGVGIWALGYDKGHDDFWNVIHDELSAIPENMPNPGGENKEAGTNEGKANPNTNVNTKGKIGKVEKESGPIMTAISAMLGLPDPESKINKLEEKLPAVTDYKYVLLYTLSFLLLFGVAGFFIALLFTDTRAVFFSTRTLKTYYMIAVLTLTVVVVRMFNWIGDHSIMLLAGFVLGGAAFYTANKVVERMKRDLP